jgi:hypothetical protein
MIDVSGLLVSAVLSVAVVRVLTDSDTVDIDILPGEIIGLQHNVGPR